MTWGTRFEALITEAEALLEPFICKYPCGVGGSQPGRHGNGCCWNTGIQTTSQEEHDVAVALRDLIGPPRFQA